MNQTHRNELSRMEVDSLQLDCLKKSIEIRIENWVCLKILTTALRYFGPSIEDVGIFQGGNFIVFCEYLDIVTSYHKLGSILDNRISFYILT